MQTVNGQNKSGEFPNARISNGIIKLDLYLPDPESGYYRGTRFDWSGIISQVSYKGHTYFGEWKTTHNPKIHDDIVGPVEEFRTECLDVPATLGYHEAKVGEFFIKIGVGLLEKIDEPNYRSVYPYKITEPGMWKIGKSRDWIEFQQNLKDKKGWGYLYTKRVSLIKDEPKFTIAHSLINIGSKPIEVTQYNHNFLVIDKEPIGRNYSIRFPFAVKIKRNLKDFLKARNNEIVFKHDLEEGSLFTELEGFTNNAKDHELIIKNKKTGAGVKINGDKPIVHLNFWTVKTTICPEPYIGLNIAPKAEEKWKTDYLLFTEEHF